MTQVFEFAMRASSEIENSDRPVSLPQPGVEDFMAASDPASRRTDPLVTIAIPTFNRATWLQDCVRLALSQSYPRFEVLVSDNASTDETALVLRQFKDERLRCVRQPKNIGAIPNWNACLAQARGDYIVFVPDDDRVAPWLLERCISLIRREPEVPIVMALGEARIVASGRTLPPQASRSLRTGIWDGVDVLDEYLQRRIMVQGCTTIIRTERLRAWGGFPAGWPFASDLARHLPLLLEGKAGFINESCGAYSLHDATQTSRLALESHLDDLKKLVDLITVTAEHRIGNERRRHRLQQRARHFLARETIGIITSYRKRGARFRELLPVLRQWGSHLVALRAQDTFAATGLICWLLLPAPIIGGLRRLKRKLTLKA
ncbi:glycosyltransferase family 2 protein [Bradyrhizobium sp. 147]|uniref:glycosyltransferase family 2 protein n=1 Tax=unclassified Bradyrhizobium TaxID=2631580 RepID=UPI001FF7AE7F|nr:MULTISPECIES: glycosyltransferase family A protein [unclassified Bradyrhizobium]MCK1682798.1 glycosyltransferase family 2 protein [Bradyrhizobium sp. 147]MCK1757591.1 glycosyltransferase family 2 protein [Bradyrhizobium sp. 137]